MDMMRGLANTEKFGWVELNGSADIDHSGNANEEVILNPSDDAY